MAVASEGSRAQTNSTDATGRPGGRQRFVSGNQIRKTQCRMACGGEAATGLPVYPFPKEKEFFVEMKLQVRA